MSTKTNYYEFLRKLVSLKQDLDSFDFESSSIMVDDYDELLEHITSCIDIVVSYMPSIK